MHQFRCLYHCPGCDLPVVQEVEMMSDIISGETVHVAKPVTALLFAGLIFQMRILKRIIKGG